MLPEQLEFPPSDRPITESEIDKLPLKHFAILSPGFAIAKAWRRLPLRS
jgi:hypothetical protein